MRKILIILSVLIIILIALSYFQNSYNSSVEGIELFYKDQNWFLPYSKILSFENSNFSTMQNQEISGYDLFKILETLDIPASIGTEFVFRSKDGGNLKLIKKQNETYYLVFQENSDSQFVRLVIPSDEFSQRWIKYLTSIEIK